MLKEQDSVINAMRRMLGSVLGDLQHSKSSSNKAKLSKDGQQHFGFKHFELMSTRSVSLVQTLLYLTCSFDCRPTIGSAAHVDVLPAATLCLSALLSSLVRNRDSKLSHTQQPPSLQASCLAFSCPACSNVLCWMSHTNLPGFVLLKATASPCQTHSSLL
jgi:hypothetical protein